MTTAARTSGDPVALDDLDVVVGIQLAATYLSAELRRRLAAAGFGDLRDSHGYLMQHLVSGPASVTELAGRLGISQQAVSKSAIDLEIAGYLTRRQVPADNRARVLALTARGRRMITRSRSIRADLCAELAAAVGTEQVEAARITLHGVLRHLGGGDAIARRSVLAPK